MANNPTHPNIFKYYLAHILFGVTLTMPITVLYYLSFGLSFFDIASLESFFLITTIIFEIPTGALADTVGRKYSAAIGMSSVALGLVIISTGSTYAQFAIAQIILGIGAAMRSGADTSLIFDSLKDADLTNQYTKIEGTSFALFSLTSAITAPIGAYLFVFNQRVPFLIEALFMLCIAIIFILMVEPQKNNNPAKNYWATLVRGLKQPLHDSQIRWYFILIFFIASIIGFFSIIIMQPLIIFKGINVMHIGYVFSAGSLVGALAAIYADKIASLATERFSLMLIIFIPAVSLLLMGVNNAFVFIIFLLLYFGARGFGYPMLKKYIQQRLSSDTRTTVLSIENLLDSLAGAISLPLFGFIADRISINYTTVLLGALLLLGGSLLMAIRPADHVFALPEN